MFGAKPRPEKPASNTPVAGFDDSVVKWALTGKWLTLALARFDSTFSTNSDFRYFDDPVAYGVVHF